MKWGMKSMYREARGCCAVPAMRGRVAQTPPRLFYCFVIKLNNLREGTRPVIACGQKYE